MANLVTLVEAKAHLRITDDAENDVIWARLQAAQTIVLGHLTQLDDTWEATKAAWEATTVPLAVKQAILLQFGELSRVRGDDHPADAAERDVPRALDPVVEALLMPYRDPGIA